MRKLIVLTAAAVGLLAIAGVADAAREGGGSASLSAYYPDIRTVVPRHLNLVNEHQKEILRFSNGIANTGPGPWALAPDRPLETATEVVGATQQIRSTNAYYECGPDAPAPPDCFQVLRTIPTGTFEFHPAHNHWHIGEVALFEVRKGDPYKGPIVGNNSIKTTFCLIDWYQLDLKSPNTTERAFFDCYKSYQGVSSGWVDQYHQSTSGQAVDLTGVPNATDYYLVSTSNHAGIYTELDYTNNTAWVKFSLTQDSNGNRKVTLLGNSPCDSPGLCGEGATNR